MIVQNHVPRFPLNQFVDYFLQYEDYNPTHSIDRFLPDGNVELIIDCNDQPKFIYDNETLTEIQACQHAWASGFRTRPISIHSGKASSMIIVYFRKGMAYPFFPVPMNEMSDRVVAADLLWGRKFAQLRESVLESRGAQRRFEIIEDFLIAHFRARFIPNPCVAYAVSEILNRPDQVTLSKLNQKIGYSQKHLISLFRSQVGVTPKAFAKVIRFQKTVIEIEQSRKVNWRAISQDCGFYDQAHFINDFRNFSGFTPAEYVRRKNGNLNYVPVA